MSEAMRRFVDALRDLGRALWACYRDALLRGRDWLAASRRHRLLFVVAVVNIVLWVLVLEVVRR